MKKIFTLLLILLILPSVLAVNLKVEQINSSEVMVSGLNKPATYDLKVTNLGEADNFRFDNLLGFSMFPIGTVFIDSGKTKDVQLIVYPREDLDYKGFYSFQFNIMGQDLTKIQEELTIKIIDLEDVFEIGSGEIDPESNSLGIYIHNKENFNFEEINAKFSSAFFEITENFSLMPNERKDFSVQLDNSDFEKLMAGFYTLNAKVSVENEKADIEGVIKFAEKNIVTTTKKDYGFVINTKIIEKTNKGNVLTKSETILKKNIISRLFTSFSPEPDVVDRVGVNIYYTWSNEIKPGEKAEIIVKTNWLFPLLIILFVIAIVILTKQYSKTNLSLRKKVSFVKAKGGEFALKVTIFVHAKKYVERVGIVDRLPGLVKIYERFGEYKPTKIDETNKRLEWNFEKLEEGETRMLSYIIYSKVGVLGKFALPATTAIYERNGEIHESESNKAFFIAEPRKQEVEEE
ncbi:hypothetical protein CMI40_00600 [Candidatus Pacearchaeota archaeon]|jgi:hypothetical protein|nr:hypothetical protein [Candidatus Pacearchaeota archaeon]|tara:strand:- start:53 stop:1435 length:1383 start_codon:yes stop_codon:yes gene_type:complete